MFKNFKWDATWNNRLAFIAVIVLTAIISSGVTYLTTKSHIECTAKGGKFVYDPETGGVECQTRSFWRPFGLKKGETSENDLPKE